MMAMFNFFQIDNLSISGRVGQAFTDDDP